MVMLVLTTAPSLYKTGWSLPNVRTTLLNDPILRTVAETTPEELANLLHHRERRTEKARLTVRMAVFTTLRTLETTNDLWVAVDTLLSLCVSLEAV